MKFRDIQNEKNLLLGSQKFLRRIICKEIVIIQMLARRLFDFLRQTRLEQKSKAYTGLC